jgi:hypothetical protein
MFQTQSSSGIVLTLCVMKFKVYVAEVLEFRSVQVNVAHVSVAKRYAYTFSARGWEDSGTNGLASSVLVRNQPCSSRRLGTETVKWGLLYLETSSVRD